MALRRCFLFACLLSMNLSGCAALPSTEASTAAPTLVVPSTTPTVVPSGTTTEPPTPTETPVPLVPDFDHIIIVVFENKEFGTVVNSPDMPYFNQLAKSYTLLTQFYAETHPSLPNYLAMIGGDTYGVTFDCTSCIEDGTTLPDLIEAKGLTWKTYQEDMPSACFAGAEAGNYAIKHNPFLYFKPIRLDAARCNRSIVPFTQLSVDLAAGTLPNYVFITPNLCNDAHDCPVKVADGWLKGLIDQLLPPLDAEGKPYLIVITWDEGQGNHSCCGLPAEAGGRIATILVSPQVKNGFEDATPYTHYSLLKTISEAWHLSYLGHAAEADNVLITAPWK
jgi:phosphatidylinositol-3-phosphatase